jgi:hypothetical protein
MTEIKMKKRNEQAFSLRIRTGNASVAISVDTRPKKIENKKRKLKKEKNNRFSIQDEGSKS